MHTLAALITGIALVASNATAQEVLVDCRFDYKPLKASDLAKSKEKEAMEWFNDLKFTRRAFVLNLSASKITDGPGPTDFLKQPQVTVTTQDIEIEWQIHAAPLDRSPRLWMKVNRFSGVATEGYSMLAGPNRGPRTMYWGRQGECSFHNRKV
jgi:hypothetical protein